MKKLIIIVTIILLAVNVLAGQIISAYSTFSLLLSSGTIVASALLMYALHTIRMNDGFVIGLSFVQVTLGIIEFILSILSKPLLQDNGHFVSIVFLIALQVICLVICNMNSKQINSKNN